MRLLPLLVLVALALLAFAADPDTEAEVQTDSYLVHDYTLIDPSRSERCQSNSDCSAPFYCQKDSCKDRFGTCSTSAPRCSNAYDPVCGCNGQTYRNGCLAITDRQNVAYKGECKPNKDVCRCNSDCRKDEFCAKTERKCQDKGECAKKPQACTMEYNPVCGCDGVTHGNPCAARSAGASVAYIGECVEFNKDQCDKDEDESCRSNRDCPNGEFCQKDKYQCSNFLAKGKCVDVKPFCTREYNPVCGCDRQTYSNACLARVAHVNIAYDGACRTYHPPGPYPRPTPRAGGRNDDD